MLLHVHLFTLLRVQCVTKAFRYLIISLLHILKKGTFRQKIKFVCPLHRHVYTRAAYCLNVSLKHASYKIKTIFTPWRPVNLFYDAFCMAYRRVMGLRGGVRFPVEARDFFLFSTSFRPFLGPTKRPLQWVSEALSPGVKRSRREADHSPPSSAEFKNGAAMPPFSHTSS
jgi:hypothetical protein